MDTIIEYLESAMKNIVSNKMRTGLTMLGIIIGIASVIAVITLGNGMATYVTNEVNALGGNVADLYLDTSVTDDWFDAEDERLVKEAFPQLLGTSFNVADMGVASGNRGAFDAAVYGVESDYQYSVGTKVKDGHYFTKDQVDSGARVCVLMENDAKHLFGTTQAVGRTVEVSIGGSSVELEVIGVKENWSDMIMQMMELEGYFAYIEMPLSTFGNAFGYNVKEFSTLELYWPQNQPESIVSDVVRFFENRKGLRGQDAIYQMSMSDVSSEVNSIMGAVTTFISFVAAISLLVGGIGVMNIMLVSVTERTREIGIRKSIGARTKSIMIQFLAESSIISLMGGIVGVVLGIVAAEIGCRILEFSVTIDPVTVIGAAFFSMAIGLFFGIYPARKAAKLKPIDALARR